MTPPAEGTMEKHVTVKQSIRELIRTAPDQISRLFVAREARGSDIADIVRLAKAHRVSFHVVPRAKILALCNKGYSGVLAVVTRIEYFTLDEALERLGGLPAVTVLVLDEIADPQNFGAILRTAAAFAVNAVVIQQWNQCPVTGTVVDVSRGAAKIVPIVREKNIFNAVKRLKDEGYWVFGTMPDTTDRSRTVSMERLAENRVVIVVGNEHKGIRRNVADACDGIIVIPHAERVQSLNVSVAAGVVLYERFKSLVARRR
jgi:23S rRNA (guanosine2251-2'-O)-methyltransferase